MKLDAAPHPYQRGADGAAPPPRVAVYQHEDCSRHDTGWRHPEHQGRLRAVSDGLSGLLPELAGQVVSERGEPLDRQSVEAVHRPEMVRRVREAVAEARRRGEPVHLTPDTVVSGASWDAALAATGCAVQATADVLEGRYGSAFCAVRPPGHHATPTRAMGFCLVNGVALAARHALERGGADRVLIVDWDVHHGNGTQAIFYEDPRVFYLSMHQSPHYPGTGAPDERGRGEGEGATLNVALPPGLPRERYRRELLEGLETALDGFRPDLVLLSCGFDAAEGDPLGGFTLTADDYRELTRELIRRTRDSAEGRLVSVLEGGYDTDALGTLAAEHLRGHLEATEGEETA